MEIYKNQLVYKQKIVDLIRDFEIEEGESFFSRVDNIINNKNFLKWLKTKHPNIYNYVEINHFESEFRPVGNLELECLKWEDDNLDMMEYICYDIDSYFRETYSDDDCKCADATYNIVAEYLQEVETNALNVIKQGIDNYRKLEY